jgi:hypothetical protein
VRSEEKRRRGEEEKRRRGEEETNLAQMFRSRRGASPSRFGLRLKRER